MSKKKKKKMQGSNEPAMVINSIAQNPEKQEDSSYTEDHVVAATVVAQDMNDISDATSQAMKDINKVVYQDNLKEPSSSSKTIRELALEDPIPTEKKEVIEEDPIYTPVKTKKSKGWLIVLICCLVVLILLGVLSTVFALVHSYSNKMANGLFVYGVDISGLTQEDALNKVSEQLQNKMASPLTLQHQEYTQDVFAEQFEVNFAIQETIDAAYAKGRSKSIFENNFDILASFFQKTNLVPSLSYNEETFQSLVTEMQSNLPDKVVDASYYIDGNHLILTQGVDGVVIDTEALKQDIIYYFNNASGVSSTISIPVIQKTAKTLDIAKVHDEIYKAPQDAYYTKDPYVVHPAVDGIDFAISMEEVMAMLQEPKENYSIPLKVLSPSVPTSAIGTEAFPDLLGSYSTTYSTSNSNRSTNISLAAKKINGIVIMPGETFSYNQTVGKRTAAAGFKSAAVYSNGEVTTGIGGGICQVSSTLYNAVLLANLQIVERTNHGFNPGYVPASRDATVSWGGPDFKFKNNRDYPVKIVCSASGGKIHFQVFGLKSNPEYEVVIESSVTASIAYKTIYQNTTSLAKGKQKVIQNGSNGCKSVAYRVLKQNGKEVSRELLSRDTYNPHNKIVSVGI